MMKLIDEIKPEFIYSLHNSGFGGTYWYLTEDIKEVYDDLYNATKKQEIPISLGEPELPHLKEFSPAIFKNLDIRDDYDYLEKYGTDNISEAIKVGNCTAVYAKSKFDSFTLLTELPYFFILV